MTENNGGAGHPTPLGEPDDHGSAFVKMFEHGWTLPKPGAFLDYFSPRIHPEIVARQPMTPTVRGRAAFEKMFRRFFALLPDLTLTVDRWVAQGDVIFTESTCRGSLGGRPIEFSVCDRFVLSAGLIADRRVYLDPSPILRAILTRPRAWPRVLAAVFQRD